MTNRHTIDVTLKTRVKSITLETNANGQETEKCLLTLAEENTYVVGAHIVMDFSHDGKGALHVGQFLELHVRMSATHDEETQWRRDTN